MLREGSGGKGQYNGGEGVIRRMRFTRPLTLSVLCERRAFQPYGMAGGEPGATGRNTLIRKGKRQNIGAKASIPVDAGDVFLLETPGGGGYGDPSLAAGRASAAPSSLSSSSGGRGKVGATSGVATGGSLGEYAANQESA